MAKCNGRFLTKKSAGYKVIYDPVDVGISVSNSVRSDGGGGGVRAPGPPLDPPPA